MNNMNAGTGVERGPSSAMRTLLVLGCWSTLIVVAPTTAQEATAAPEKAGREHEEIVVTAQKREQSVQDVGIAITAFSGEMLQDLGVSESIGIAAQTPNLSIGLPVGEGNQPSIFLRGVGLNDFNTNNNGPIGIYNDEVYASVISAQNFLLFDLERVEVLRGPQGTLYGRNTTGGAVKFISKRPTKTLDGFVRASYSDFNTTKIETAISGPISQNWAARLSGVKIDSDGYVNNLLTGNDNNGIDTAGYRAQIEGQISDKFEILLNVHGSGNRSQAAQYGHQGLIDPSSGAACTVQQVVAGGCVDALGYSDTSGFLEGNYDREGGIDRDNFGMSVTATFGIGDVEIVSVSSYEYVDSLVEEETDAGPGQMLNLDYRTDAKTYTQELRASGQGDKSYWLAGVYALSEDLNQDQTVDLFRALRPLVESIDPVSFPGGFDPTGSSPAGAPIFFSRHLGSQKTTTLAAFGQFEYELTPSFRAILGARYTDESRDFTQTVRFEEPGFEVPLFSVNRQLDNRQFSWKIGGEYKTNSDALLYANVSTGFKSGGFNGGFLFDPAETEPYLEETVTAYEVGFKTSFLDKLVTFNTAAFYYDYEDMQIFTLINSGGVPLNVLTNAGNGKIYGAEFELHTRLTDELNLQLALGLLNTELQDFRSIGGQDYSGNVLVLSPKVSFSGLAQYTIPLASRGAIVLQTDFNYQSEVFFDTANNPLLSQDGYWIANARVAYQGANGRWEVAGFVRNIGNEEYLTYAIDLSDFGFNQQMRGAPRVFGIEISVAY